MALRRITYQLTAIFDSSGYPSSTHKKEAIFYCSGYFAAEVRKNTLNMGAKGSPVDMIHNLTAIFFESGPMLTPNKLVRL